MEEINKMIANRILELCEKSNLLMVDLEIKSRLPYDFLIKISCGQVKNIKISTILKLCFAFDISIGEFFHVEDFNDYKEGV